MNIEEVVVKLRSELDKASAEESGKTLEDAFGKSFDKIGVRFLNNLTQKFGLGNLGTKLVEDLGLESMMGPIGIVAGGLLGITAAVTGTAAAVYKLGEFAITSAQEVAALGTEIVRSAAKAEMSTKDFQVFAEAAKETGVSMHQLTMGFKMINKNAFEAALNPNSKSAQSFKILGMSATDASGHLKQSSDIIKEMMGRFSEFQQSPAKAASMMRLIGIRGHEMTMFMERGPKYLDELEKKMRETGEFMEGDMLKASTDYTQATIELDRAWLGFKNRFQDLGFLKAFTWVIDRASEVVTYFSKGLKQMKEYTDEGHGAALLLEIAFGPLILALGAAAFVTYEFVQGIIRMLPAIEDAILPFTLLGLAIDDFIGFMHGAPSVTGRFFEQLNKFVHESTLGKFLDLVNMLAGPGWGAAWDAAQTFFGPLITSLRIANALMSHIPGLHGEVTGQAPTSSGPSVGFDAPGLGVHVVGPALSAPQTLSAPASQASSTPPGGTNNTKIDLTINAHTNATAGDIASHVDNVFARYFSDAQEHVRR